LSGGVVMGKAQFTVAEGNIYDGITRTDYKYEAKAISGILSTGFDYILNKNINVNLNLGYSHSDRFNKRIGGFNNYNGVQINTSLALIF
jgi:hypothetical protein